MRIAAGDDEIGRAGDVERVQAQGAREVVPRAARHDSQRDGGAGELLDGEADRPVTAGDHDGVGAEVDRRPQERGRLLGASRR